MKALEDVTVIVPARDEKEAIAAVVRELTSEGAREVIVVDNGSRDGTGERARDAGARVVHEPRPGYGWACATGLGAVGDGELIGFIDGDGSFEAHDLARLAGVARETGADLVLGARRGVSAFAPHQRAGNVLVLALLRSLYGVSIPDSAPLRVARADLLRRLDMHGSRYAWIMEMVAKAARLHARIAVVPVAYGARRGGRSKVSGSIRGSVLAGLDLTRTLIELRDW